MVVEVDVDGDEVHRPVIVEVSCMPTIPSGVDTLPKSLYVFQRWTNSQPLELRPCLVADH